MFSTNKARGILGASPQARACGRQVSLSARLRRVRVRVRVRRRSGGRAAARKRGEAEPRDRSRGVGPRGRVPSWKGAVRVREAQNTGRKY